MHEQQRDGTSWLCFGPLVAFFLPFKNPLPLYAAVVSTFVVAVVVLNRRTCEMRLHKRWTCFIYGILPVLQIYVFRLWNEPKEER